MKKFVSVRIISVAALAILSILLVFGNFKNKVQEEFTVNIYSRLSELSLGNAATISSKIKEQFEMMNTMSTYLSLEDLEGEKVKSVITKAVDTYGFLRCAITLPDGSVFTHDDKTTRNVTGEEHFVKGFKGLSTVRGPMPAVADSSKTVILLTTPIYKGTEIIALLTFTYETSYLDSVFSVTTFNGDGYSYVIDELGTVISRPTQGLVDFDSNNILTFLNQKHCDEYDAMSGHIKNMQSGSVLLAIGGKDYYISYQPIGINKWCVLSVISADVLDKQLDSTLSNVYSMSALIILIVLVFILLIDIYIHSLEDKSKKALEKLAYYDGLTGIYNQNMFERQARQVLDFTNLPHAYIILNVNKFKMINEIFGFTQGDNLLKYIANVLVEQAVEGDLYARFDADVFHILCRYTTNEDLEKRMLSVAKRITEYEFDKESRHKLSVGFGAYAIECNSKSISLMGDKARMALAKVKGLHTTTIYFYNNDIINQFMAEQEIENSMQSALDSEEMMVYLQPKCSTETYELRGAEALVRWQTPTNGIIMPDSFIPLFEKNGFIIKLDMYMVEAVCKKLAAWREQGISPFIISVNQSRECLYQPNYITELVHILERYAINPAFIEIEVTERAFFEDESALVSIIEQLHWHGFNVSMDDFGAGYSSLNMLQDVHVDVLKIDKNFFRESINSQRGKKIVSNIVKMANDLNIEVVAEGIETKEQLDFLKEISCGCVQGYYFSKPIPPNQFEIKYLSNNTSDNNT